MSDKEINDLTGKRMREWGCHIEEDVVLWFLSNGGQIDHPSNEGASRAYYML